MQDLRDLQDFVPGGVVERRDAVAEVGFGLGGERGEGMKTGYAPLALHAPPIHWAI